VTDLGGDEYEFLFTVTNGSLDSNAIYFWIMDSGSASLAWETVSWDVPEGWNPSHPAPDLHFFTANNSGGNPFRIYSPGASACGGISAEFRWRVLNNGGPTPECVFTVVDHTFYLQPVDPGGCWNLTDSFVCPEPVPTDVSTWGSIKHLYED
jgi:hypothetical protein